MAGNYPDVPGHRIPYDRNGSVGFHLSSTGVITSLSATRLVGGNDEDPGSTNYLDNQPNSTDTTLQRTGIILPEPHDVVGFYFSTNGGFPGSALVETSVNTTNGLDGTWVNQGTAASFNKTNSKNAMRSQISAVTWSGIVGVRVGWQGGAGEQYVYSLHVYGSPSAGEAPDRLRFWDPVLNQQVAGHHADLGDLSRNTVTSKTFRVHNPSVTLTAYSVGLTTEALTDSSPTNVGQYEFSVNSGAYASTANLGDLAPGATSPIITWRRTTPASAALSVWNVRAVASAASYAP